MPEVIFDNHFLLDRRETGAYDMINQPPLLNAAFTPGAEQSLLMYQELGDAREPHVSYLNSRVTRLLCTSDFSWIR